jgi:predicted DNA-binding protein
MKQQEIKTTFMLPEEIHKRLKKRAIDEGRPVKEIVLEAIELYLANRALSKPTQKDGREIVKLMKEHVEGAGPEDFLEYDFYDIEG